MLAGLKAVGQNKNKQVNHDYNTLASFSYKRSV